MTEQRITVSEDKLDAKLAALELRLVDRITSALEAKADAAVVRELQTKIQLVEERFGRDIRELRESQAGQKALSSAQKFWFGTVGVGVLGAIATLIWLATS